MNPRAGRGATPRPNVFPLTPGRIAIAPIRPTKGFKKPRPSIVLMESPADHNRLIVVGITTDGGRYDPADTRRYPPDAYLSVPSAKDGSASTGLHRTSAAYAGFVQDFDRSELEGTGGSVDGAFLDSLIRWLQAYFRKQQAAPQ